MKKLITTLLFVLAFTLVKAQYGLFEWNIKLPDKNLNKIINDSIVSSVSTGNALTFYSSDFYVPMGVEDKGQMLKESGLLKKELVGLKAVGEWDVQKGQLIIIGLAPLYLHDKKPPFYFAGNFLILFNESNYKHIKAHVQSAFFQLVSNVSLKPEESNATIREINVSEFNCIYHVEFSYLPKLLLKKWAQFLLIFHNEYYCENETSYYEHMLESDHKIEKIVLYEQWSDTTILNNNFGPNPLPFDTDYLKRKAMAIGLVLADGKTVWAKYDDYKAMLTKITDKANNYKFMIYDLYFQSSFCRQLKMDMIIK